MSSEVVVGLDVGTTSVKFVAVDSSSTVVAESASSEIAVRAVEPGQAEQSTRDIWAAAAEACERGVALLGSHDTVVGIAVASQSGSVVPVTDAGPGRVITWMDRRSAPLVDGWDDDVKQVVRQTSGWSVSPGLGLATIAWLQAADPSAAVARWASVDDWTMWRLTGSWITNPSNAAGMQLTEAGSGRWSTPLCDLAGVDEGRLSAIADSGTVGGELTADAAAALSLPEGMPVVIGGHDQACGALGLGAVAEGTAMMSVGTAWVITVATAFVSEAAVPAGFNLSPHVVGEVQSVSRNLGGLGAALASYFADLPDGLEFGSVEASFRLPDDDFFIVDLSLPATGWGTFRDSGQSALLRLAAVAEACAFEARIALEDLGSLAGGGDITVVGGGTQSPLITQTLADVLGRAIVARPDASWPAIGAARLAASALGWSIDPGATLPSVRIEPRYEQEPVLESRYQRYLELRSEEHS